MSDSAPHATFLAPEPAELAPLFPGYEIDMLIATGGMGAVYRAIQKSLERTVAIKILPREFSNDPAFCAGFEAEAKAMARLNHINLVGVYDFGEVDGMLFIIMEYIVGKSLFHSSNGSAIDPSEVIRLVTGICEGLAHAHENGILHRDIKPSNILLDQSAQPKIGDFGLARPVETKTQEGEEIFGTPHYTAPEVVDSPNSVDYRADIFSVGVLLHELLTGRLPADDPRPASAISHCDPRFDAIVRRATHPNPNGRYGSALEISQDLLNIATSAGPRVLKTTTPRNLGKPARPVTNSRLFAQPKSSGSPFLTFLIILIIGGIIAYLLLSKKPIIVPTTTPPPPAAVALLPKTQQNLSRSETSLAQQQKHQRERELQMEQEKERELQQQQERKQLREREMQQAREKKQPPEKKQQLPAEPKFDVPAFLKHARTIMSERANPAIAERDEKFDISIDSFEEDIKRLTRTIKDDKKRKSAENALNDYTNLCKSSKTYLPKKFDHARHLKRVPDAEKLHEEHVAKQKSADSELARAMAQLAPTYIFGLQKQIERLNPTNDQAAISLLEKEIAATQANEDHFPSLMLGSPPKHGGND